MILINRTILYSLIFATALISTTSCSFNEFEDPSKIVNISKEIEVRLLPDLQSASKLNWLITSKENKYCHDAVLNTHLVDVPSRYELLINGITTPESCQPFNSHVHSLESFNKTDIARFQVTFPNALTSQIILSRQDNAYSLTASDQEHFAFSQKELLDFEKLTFWAGIKDASTENFGKMLFTLQDFATSYDYEDLTDGDYGYVKKILGNQQVVNPSNFETYEDSFSFQISDEIDYAELIIDLETIVADFRAEYPDLEFFVASSTGIVL